MKRRIPGIAWLLLGVLVLASVVISLSKQSDRAEPFADSYGPSGLKLFASLLEDRGHPVVSTRSTTPDLRRGDVAVACISEADPTSLEGKAGGIGRTLRAFVERGGKLLLLSLDPDFARGSARTEPATVRFVPSGDSRPVRLRPAWTQFAIRSVLSADLVSIPLWMEQNALESEVAWMTRVGKGAVVTVGDGYLATNRFIDREKNVDVVMTGIAALAPTNARVVFTEATFSRESPSLIGILGPGATAAWYQLWFLFAVVVYTLGKRFGLPDESRSAQVGQRELADAVADVYRRAGAGAIACRAAYMRADERVRKAIKLGADAPASERDTRLPPALAEEFRLAYVASLSPIKSRDAFARCRALKRETDAFLHQPKG